MALPEVMVSVLLLGGMLLGIVLGFLGRAGTVGRLQSRLELQHGELANSAGQLAAATKELQRLRAAHQALQQRQAATAATQAAREQQHVEQLALLGENRAQLTREFENLANRIFEEKGTRFTHTSRESVEAMLQPFREQISGFQARVNEVHSQSLQGNAALEAEIRKVLEVGLKMNDRAENLTLALKGDNKIAGNWGEAQLERTLEMAGLLRDEHYESQTSFTDAEGKRHLPDCLIRLPGGKNLIIDSKVSLVDYERAVTADTEEERELALTSHVQAVRNHIDDLAAKDYANLPNVGSPSFVLMFMPIEPAYIEAMKKSSDLFNYGYSKNVILVSHTTLMPILRTVANLWMIDRSSRETQQISDAAGDLFNQVCLISERLGGLGKSLAAATNHYNRTVTALAGSQGLHGKVERFKSLSAKASKDLPAIETLDMDVEAERLGMVTGDAGDTGSDTAEDNSAD